MAPGPRYGRPASSQKGTPITPAVAARKIARVLGGATLADASIGTLRAELVPLLAAPEGGELVRRLAEAEDAAGSLIRHLRLALAITLQMPPPACGGHMPPGRR